MFRIRFNLIRIRIIGSVSWNNGFGSGSGPGSCSRSDRKYQLWKKIVFCLKYISPKNDLFCYLLGKYLCLLNKKSIFSKNVWYSCDFGGFLRKFSMILANFSATRIRFGKRIREMKRIRIRNTAKKMCLCLCGRVVQ